MTFLRTALSLVAAAVALLVTATPALAHTALKSSNPADGASLDSPPSTVTLTFEEAVTLPAHPISISGPGGVSWTVGTPTISGASVTAPVQATGPAGQYILHYTVTADDGDAVRGTVGFNLSGAATPATAATAPTGADVAPATAAPGATAQGSSDSGGSSGWTWVAVVVVLLGVAGAGYTVLHVRRRARTGRR